MSEPGSPEWKERVAQIEAEEAEQPERLWYLSFAGLEGWRGACFVRARGLVSATKEAHAKSCNPGGEIKAAPLMENFELADEWMNKLLSLEDLERMDREVFGEEEGPVRW